LRKLLGKFTANIWSPSNSYHFIIHIQENIDDKNPLVMLKMSSQNYRNGVQEWDEKLEQCPYYPSHQIRPTRFGHHLLQCRKALSKQPTSPYYHKIDDLVVSKYIFIRQ
jgi:hypothetical protein